MTPEPKLSFICDNKRHLVCEPYSSDNLHQMARELGLSPRWFHRGRYPHYDIPKRRIAEIKERCHLVTSRQIFGIIKAGLAIERQPKLVWSKAA